MDIYFTEKYGELYEKIEGGTCEKFNYESDKGRIINIFIKRPINKIINGVKYYDLITPYGYGGPIILECNKNSSREDLVNDYNKSFEKYCEKEKIVSEFVRFHPVLKNHNDFKRNYDLEYMRKTLGTNLAGFEDPFQSEFSKSCRKNIRRAINKGITYTVNEKPDNIVGFMEVYYSTMDRNNANEYYYFDEEYFNNILEKFPNNVILVNAIFEGKVIASGLYFIYRNFIHIHLSGTLNEYLELSPAYILRYAVTLWGKKNGYELIHHGGGTTNSDNDSLFLFKKRFSKNTEFDFYIGKKIWNEKIYKKLCDFERVDDNFFPSYRSKTTKESS